MENTLPTLIPASKSQPLAAHKPNILRAQPSSGALRDSTNTRTSVAPSAQPARPGAKPLKRLRQAGRPVTASAGASENCDMGRLGKRKQGLCAAGAARGTGAGPVRNPATMAKRNARERRRVQNINSTLESLERILPEHYAERKDKSKRLSKLEVLRSTIDYIQTLQCVLSDDGSVGGGGAHHSLLLAAAGIDPALLHSFLPPHFHQNSAASQQHLAPPPPHLAQPHSLDMHSGYMMDTAQMHHASLQHPGHFGAPVHGDPWATPDCSSHQQHLTHCMPSPITVAPQTMPPQHPSMMLSEAPTISQSQSMMTSQAMMQSPHIMTSHSPSVTSQHSYGPLDDSVVTSGMFGGGAAEGYMSGMAQDPAWLLV